MWFLSILAALLGKAGTPNPPASPLPSLTSSPLQVSLVAISILGGPLAPTPLSPITNTGGMGYGLQQPPFPSPVSSALGLGLPQGLGPGVGVMPEAPPHAYLPLAGQQLYLQNPALGAQPAVAAAAQQQYAASAAGLRPGLGAAVPPPLGAPPTKEESAAALAAELGVDTVTAQRIQELTLQKQQVGRGVAEACWAGS